MKENRQKKSKPQGLSKQKPEQKPAEPPKQKPATKQVEQPRLLADKLQEEVNAKLAALSEKILAQDKQQEETNAKIVALANAVGSLNEEFTRFIDTLKAQTASAQSTQTPPQASAEDPPGGGNAKPLPGFNILAPKEPPQQATEPSKQDRLLAWADILAKLAQAGGGGGAQADANAMPNSLMQLVNSLKVMGELRKTFLGELKEMLSFAKGIETTVKRPPAKLEGTTHLHEE